jgi:tryptophan synthase alpha chain
MSFPIAEAFRKAESEDRATFIPFLTAGFPDYATAEEILVALEDNGADIIEIGLPFSDPLADGPTIQHSSRIALDNGVTPPEVFRFVSRVRSRLSCPLVIMTYVNPVLSMGLDMFAAKAKETGVSGVIIPDLPPEEAEDWIKAADDQNVDTIFLVAPNTPLPRTEFVSSKTSGFLYYVSMTGTTGSDVVLTDDVLNHLNHVRNKSDSPVAIGFGISQPEHAAALASKADGVIVGSAIIREIIAQESPKAQVQSVSKFARSMSQALHRESRSGAQSDNTQKRIA